MKIYIETPVNGYYKDVLSRFDKNLFLALKPSGMKLDLLRFDGSEEGDYVHLRIMPFGLFRQEWLVKITESAENAQQAWFVDEGQSLPWMFAYWRHQHIVRKVSETQSQIVDDITYHGRFFVLGLLLFPIMYIQFYLRKPIYKRYFS
jgi:ligand-binding SRPBCC domain-containing protein